MTVACAARQTPAPIEYLLRKAGLSQEESILSSDERNFMSQLTTKLSDRRGQRASTEADEVAKPVIHKTKTPSAGSLQRLVQVSRYAADRIH